MREGKAEGEAVEGEGLQMWWEGEDGAHELRGVDR